LYHISLILLLFVVELSISNWYTSLKYVIRFDKKIIKSEWYHIQLTLNLFLVKLNFLKWYTSIKYLIDSTLSMYMLTTEVF